VWVWISRIMGVVAMLIGITSLQVIVNDSKIVELSNPTVHWTSNSCKPYYRK